MTRRAALATVVAVIVTACSGSATDELALPTTDTTDTQVTVATDSAGPDTSETTPATTPATLATTTSSTEPAPTTTEDPGPPVDEAQALWVEAWQIASRADVTPADLEGVATEKAASDLIELMGLGEGESRTITNNPVPVLEDQIPDAVFFDDCMHLDPYPTEETTHWYSGTVEPIDGELLVSVVTAELFTGCVPGVIAEAVLADYEDRVDAVPDYWRPANPESPRLRETVAEPLLSTLLERLTDHRDQGIELRNTPEIHPEIASYEPGKVVVLDCALVSRDYGLYATETGERLPETPEQAVGARSLSSSVMVFEGGRWKDSERGGTVGAECEFAPTRAGVALV